MKYVLSLIASCACVVQLYSQITNHFPATGSVGIGTTSPIGALQVNNGVSIFSNPNGNNHNENIRLPVASNGFACLALGAIPGLAGTGEGQWALARNPDKRFSIWHRDDERFTILPNGNVGIGTTTPAAKLNIVGDMFIDNLDWSTDNAMRIREGMSEQYGAFFKYGLNDLLTIGTRNENIDYAAFQISRGSLNVVFNGNVGIGSTSPQMKLDVSGNARILNNLNIWADASGTTGAFSLRTITGRNFILQDEYAGAERLRVLSNGNVGIGTTNPQSKLAVNGDVFAKKVKVTQSGWPDYVFNKEYELMPLKDVEAFILKHKHLPEVPSAAEIAKNDLDLGEMDRILLQKIEELTLYVIELKKITTALQQENEELKSALIKNNNQK